MPKITKARLTRLQNKYVTDAAIGRKLGVTRQNIHRLRKELGVEPSTAKHPSRNAAIAEAYASGVSGAEVAGMFGLSPSQTYRIINMLKGKAKHAKKKVAAKPTKAPAKKAAKKAVKKRRGARNTIK